MDTPPKLEYDWEKEISCYYIAFLGLVGLLVIIFVLLSLDLRFGLCFRMPKELCEPRKRPE